MSDYGDYKKFLLFDSLEYSDTDYFPSQESYSSQSSSQSSSQPSQSKKICHMYIMGYSNGQVQSSSDSGKAQKGDPGLPGIGFNLTDDGNFDLDGKRLTDVADPVDNGDAVTKGYVDTENTKRDNAINSKAEKAYVDSENSKQEIAINIKAEKNKVLLLDESQSMNANLNLNNKKNY